MHENKLVTLTLPLNSLYEVLKAALNITYEYAGAKDVEDVIWPALVDVVTHVKDQIGIPDEHSFLNNV